MGGFDGHTIGRKPTVSSALGQRVHFPRSGLVMPCPAGYGAVTFGPSVV